MDSIAALVDDIAASLARVDATKPVGPARRFLPGVGPLTEGELTDALLKDLAAPQAPRAERLVEGLVHPHHQQARVYGWEVLGVDSPAALTSL